MDGKVKIDWSKVEGFRTTPPCPARCADAYHGGRDCSCRCHDGLRDTEPAAAEIDWARLLAKVDKVCAPLAREKRGENDER